jgi:hypothetical protein
MQIAAIDVPPAWSVKEVARHRVISAAAIDHRAAHPPHVIRDASGPTTSSDYSRLMNACGSTGDLR